MRCGSNRLGSRGISQDGGLRKPVLILAKNTNSLSIEIVSLPHVCSRRWSHGGTVLQVIQTVTLSESFHFCPSESNKVFKTYTNSV